MKVHELIEALQALKYDGANAVIYNSVLNEECSIVKVIVDDEEGTVVIYGDDSE